jgi:hypothetical protein
LQADNLINIFAVLPELRDQGLLICSIKAVANAFSRILSQS